MSQFLSIRVGRRSFNPIEFYNRYIRAMVAATIGELYLRIGRSPRRDHITLFGHSLDGNLKALLEYLQLHRPNLHVYVMTDSRRQYGTLKRVELPSNAAGVLSSQRIRDVLTAARSQAIITSHGPISLFRWMGITATKRPLLVDVWHGVGYKGSTVGRAYAKMAGYDNHFVPSETVKQFYIENGIHQARITVTGFARTDELVDLNLSPQEREKILQYYRLSDIGGRNIVLYAPTWDEKDGENIYPFNLSADAFFEQMDKFATSHNCVIVFRPHQNTKWHLDPIYSHNLRLLSALDFPLSEPLLKITDVLITDWSSIFADFLALKRPVIFVDKDPTFGDYIAPLTLEDRPGAITYSIDELFSALSLAINSPDRYYKKYEHVIESTIEHAWGNSLDSKSSERYLDALDTLSEKETV